MTFTAWPHVQRLILALALLAGAFSFFSFIYYWDATRVVIKRLTAPSPYIYEEIDPKYLQFKPADFIAIASPEAATAARLRLINAILGTDSLPLDARPADSQDIALSPHCASYDFSSLNNLARFECVRIHVDNTYKATFGFFHPRQKTTKLMIYHHGYASTYETQKAHFKTLLEAGYAVIAHNLAGYGDNSPFLAFDAAERPLRPFFEPVVISINYAMDQLGYQSVHMMGLSAGGWMTAVSAALDDRIKHSYPIAGVLPLYLRTDKETASPQYYEPMLKAADYLDMFILGSWGEGRRQLQIFNRYDRCCFANTRGKLYEAAVANAVSKLGPGQFGVMIDESHARHKISGLAMKTIMADLKKAKSK